MRHRDGGRALLLAAAVAGLFLATRGMQPHPTAGSAPNPTPTIDPRYCGPNQTVSLASALPPDLPSLTQPAADCYAWQNFIALNWRADPNNPGAPDPNAGAAEFGVPVLRAPSPRPQITVWETYKEQADALDVEPSTFATPQRLPPRLAHALGERARAPRTFGYHVLTQTSKLGNIRFDPHDINQAFTGGAWLTDQNHGLTYYEVRLNPDEFAYISQNALALPAAQTRCAEAPGGFSLPDGSPSDTLCDGKTPPNPAYGTAGAIEIKAAWIELTDPALFPQYLVADAIIEYPDGTVNDNAVVGLVGLHIIRKTVRAQQFVWTTFEHVDNVPTVTPGGAPPAPGASPFTFYNPGCTAASDHYRCALNAGAPGTMPQPLVDPYAAPVQAVRRSTLPATARTLNAAVWSILPANSVFRHYMLVDALWPNSSTPVPPRSVTPLYSGNLVSDMRPLVNTTMETYFQDADIPLYRNNGGPANGCMACHQSAPVAAVPQPSVQAATVRDGADPFVVRLGQQQAEGKGSLVGGGTPYASDYSFIFMNAVTPSAAPVAQPSR